MFLDDSCGPVLFACLSSISQVHRGHNNCIFIFLSSGVKKRLFFFFSARSPLLKKTLIPVLKHTENSSILFASSKRRSLLGVHIHRAAVWKPASWRLQSATFSGKNLLVVDLLKKLPGLMGKSRREVFTDGEMLSV